MQSPTFTLHLKEHECDVKDQELLKEILTKCIKERTNYRDMKPIVENQLGGEFLAKKSGVNIPSKNQAP